MAKKPCFSVVIPLYNKAKHINRSIDSVLQQSYQDFEIIVVNDGSSDGGEDLVKQYDDPRITLFEQENAGVSVARNKGIELSNGEYIAFLDADDEWMPHYLEEIRNLIVLFPEAKMYSTAYTIKHKDGSLENQSYHPLPEHPWQGIIPNYIECMLNGGNPIWTSAFCINRKVIDIVGGFIPGMKIGEDTELLLRIVFKYLCAFSTERCAVYYQDSTNRSNIIPDFLHEKYKFVQIMQKMLDKGAVPDNYKLYMNRLISDQLLNIANFFLFQGKKKEALQILLDYRVRYNKKKKLRLFAKLMVPSPIKTLLKKINKYIKTIL